VVQNFRSFLLALFWAILIGASYKVYGAQHKSYNIM
jgi:membrane protein required for beta-lactamase induction